MYHDLASYGHVHEENVFDFTPQPVGRNWRGLLSGASRAFGTLAAIMEHRSVRSAIG